MLAVVRSHITCSLLSYSLTSPLLDYHIGKHRQLESHSLIRDRVNASTSDLALGTVSNLVASQVFTDWFRQPVAGSRFVIGALDEDLKRRLGAKQKAVLLSDETLAKQKQHHPELSLAEYRLLPEVIVKGKAIEFGEQNIHFYTTHGRLYRAVVKTTEKRHENYLTTFHISRDKQLAKDLKNGKLIRE